MKPGWELKPTVEITELKFNIGGNEGAIEARGFLRVDHGTCVEFHRLLSEEDAAALEPILERIAERVRGFVGEAMKRTETKWYVSD